jgi:hypothetical protein
MIMTDTGVVSSDQRRGGLEGQAQRKGHQSTQTTQFQFLLCRVPDA